MDVEKLNWFVGLIEGEGSFYINIAMRTGGFGVIPSFTLFLSEKDRETITSIRGMLGFGRIVFKSNEIWKRKGMFNVQNQYGYVITSIEDAQKFIEIFNENLFRTSKKKDYLLWKEAVKIIKDYRHLTYEGFIHICEIRDKMNLKQKRKNYKNKNWFLKQLKNKKNFFSEKNIQKRKRASMSVRRLNKIKA